MVVLKGRSQACCHSHESAKAQNVDFLDLGLGLTFAMAESILLDKQYYSFVLISLCYHSKLPKPGGLVQQNSIFSLYRRLQVQSADLVFSEVSLLGVQRDTVLVNSGLNNKQLCRTVLAAGKSKVKELADSVSGQGPLPGSYRTVF